MLWGYYVRKTCHVKWIVSAAYKGLKTKDSLAYEWQSIWTFPPRYLIRYPQTLCLSPAREVRPPEQSFSPLLALQALNPEPLTRVEHVFLRGIWG